mmetsp:Transcript_34324/g.45394  ORF Transcript_34324/g.45394 Transcript_34324/m.45394 type:complete len:297 (+) Transcript_34324:199-1089(+)
MNIGGSTSKSEKEFILLGIDQGIRTDGRGRLDYRPVSVETNVLPQSNGSARVVLSYGATNIIAASKVEVGPPRLDCPNEGRVEVAVQVSNALFRKFDDRASQDADAELSQALARVIKQSQTIDLKSLCIIPGKFCWVIHLDLLVLSANGNILDPASFAAYITMNTTRIPKVSVFDMEGSDEKDFEISTDIADSELIDGNNLPVSITLSKVGRHWVVDASMEEESCVAARVVVAVNCEGKVCGIYKSGDGTVALQDMPSLVHRASQTSAQIFKTLKEVISQTSIEKEFAFTSRGLLS